MSEPALKEGSEFRSMKAKQYGPKLSLALLVGFSALNIFILLFIVPKLAQIYADALPGWPLPTATNCIMAGRVFIAIATLGWPVLGVFLMRQHISYAALLINIVSIWLFLQIGITFYLLITPMIGIKYYMSEGK